MTRDFDRVFKNVRIVRPGSEGTPHCDIGVREGRFVEIAESLDVAHADDVVDAGGLLGFPGLVDAHMHIGIYGALEQDAETESSAAAAARASSSTTAEPEALSPAPADQGTDSRWPPLSVRQTPPGGRAITLLVLTVSGMVTDISTGPAATSSRSASPSA